MLQKEEIRDNVVLVGLNSPVLKEDSATEESMDELAALWDARAALEAARADCTAQEQKLAECRENPMLQQLYKEDEARKEITAAAERAAEDLDCIRGMHSPYETAMLDAFRESGELRAALEKGRSLQALAEAEERRREAALREDVPAPAARENAADALHAAPAPVFTQEPVKTFEKKAAPPKLYTLRFSVECEYEQMMALKRFLNENNIRYSRI